MNTTRNHPRRSRHRGRFAAIALTLGLVAAACGSDDEPAADSTATDPVSTADVETSDPATTDSGAPEDAGSSGGATDPDAVFRFAYYRDPPSFDPVKIAGSIDYPPIFLAVDRLFHQTPDGQVIPGIAEEATVSEDGLTWTLEIRDGLTFHDDAPLDADAVVANLQRAIELPESRSAADLAGVTSVTSSGPTTVVIELSEPDLALDLVLSERAGGMISPASFDSADIDATPVGSGMYRMVDRVVGSSISFERFDGYWDPDSVGAARFEMLILPDETARLNALQTGAIDATFVNAEFIDDASKIPDAVVDEKVGLRTIGITFNPTMVEPWADARVREAASLAVDRQAIVDNVMFGHGEATEQMVLPGMPGYVDAGAPEYDVERAKQLLADAGYPDGFTASAVLTTSPSVQIAEAIQAQLATVGIDVEIAPTPANGSSAYFYDQTEEGLFLPYSGSVDPLRMYDALYASDGTINPGGLSIDGMDELIAEAKTATDADQRADLLEQMTQLLLDTPPTFVVLFKPGQALVSSPGVVGLQWYAGNGTINFARVGLAP